MAHWGQNMIVHRSAEHYPAVFAVSKAISTTLAGWALFSQKCRDFLSRRRCDRMVLIPMSLVRSAPLPAVSEESLTTASLFDKRRC